MMSADRHALDALAEGARTPRAGALVEDQAEHHVNRPLKLPRQRTATKPSYAEQQREALAGAAGDARAAVAIAGAPPDRRAGDPAAVEREGGDQVEQRAAAR